MTPTRLATRQIDAQPPINFSTTHAVAVPRIDRWQIHQRLQELMIPCWCLPDGSLRVEIHHSINALLLRSVVQHLAPRQERLEWLERCWHLPTVS